MADFNNSVIEAEIPEGQTQVLQEIQIFDDEINEGPEAFDVLLDVLSEQRSHIMFSIQRTICRIRQSDRKLSCKHFMHLMLYTSQYRITTLSSVLYLVYNSCQFCV